MKNYAVILAAALALGSTACGAGRADDMQSQIQAAYDGQCKAAVAKDGTAFQKFFDPKFVESGLDGKQVTIDQIVAEIGSPPPNFVVAACTFAIRKLTVDGAVATVLATQTTTGTITQDGAAQPFQEISETTDVWNVAASPLQTSATETGNRTTLAGKVVDEKGTLSSPASPAPGGN